MSHKKHPKQQDFNYGLYERLAKGIHDMFCEDFDWCNYGQVLPDELKAMPDVDMPVEQRQELAKRRLEWMHHCQIAVDAENIAAHITFGKGAKVRKFRPAGWGADDDEA